MILGFLGQCSNVVIHGISGAVLTSSSAAPASSTTGLVLGLSNTFPAGIGWSKLFQGPWNRWLGVKLLWAGRLIHKVFGLTSHMSDHQLLHWDHGFSMFFPCFCLVPIKGCGHSPLRLWRRCSWRRKWRCCRWRKWRCQLVVIVQWQLALWWTCGGSSPSSRGSLGALRDTWGHTVVHHEG